MSERSLMTKRYAVPAFSLVTFLPCTVNPIVKPGVLHKRLKELAEGGDRERSGPFDSWRQGGLEPLPA